MGCMQHGADPVIVLKFHRTKSHAISVVRALALLTLRERAVAFASLPPNNPPCRRSLK